MSLRSRIIIDCIHKNHVLCFFLFSGFTLSFVYGPTVAMLSTYFEKYRGLANSISCAGVSLGGLILAPLFTYLFERYGYSGTLLLTAGVHLNIIVGGMLLRPTEFYSRRNSSQMGSNYETENKHTEDKIPLNTKNSKVSIANGNISKPNLEANGTNEACETDECNIQISPEHSPMSKSDNDRYLFPMHRKKAVLERQLSTRSNTSLEAVSAILNTSVSKYASAHFINGSSQNMYNSGMNLKDNKQKEIDKNDIKKLLATVFDFSILKDRLFLYYLLCTVFLCAGNGITPFYLAPHAKDIGIDPESTAAVLMVVNIVDLFARIIFGFVSDKDWIKRSTLIALSSAILGVANCLVYFASCYVTIMVFAVIIGLLQGIYFSLYAVVIVDYLSLEKLNNALGFCTAFQGLSIGCALPVAGKIV